MFLKLPQRVVSLTNVEIFYYGARDCDRRSETIHECTFSIIDLRSSHTVYIMEAQLVLHKSLPIELAVLK